MSFLTSIRISGSGLTAQRARVDAASSNLANIETTRTAAGGPYRRVDPVLRSVEAPGEQGVSGVTVEALVQDSSPGRRIYQPDHPDADAQGFVMLPNVDPAHEMVNLISAQRSYQANATAMETLKAMAMRALELIR